MKTLARTQLPKLDTLSMVTMGLLMAVQLVLSRFTIGNQFIRLSFTFLVVALIAKWFGPLWGMMTAAVVDIVGTLLLGSPYFVGFTISAVLGSLIYALFLYQHPVSWSRVIIAQVLIALLVNTLLNTWWLNIMYQTPFWALLPMRAVKELVVSPIQIVLLYLLLKSQLVQRIQQRLTR